jgi:hypothetical protein
MARHQGLGMEVTADLSSGRGGRGRGRAVNGIGWDGIGWDADVYHLHLIWCV